MPQPVGADFNHVETHLLPWVGFQIKLGRVAKVSALFRVHGKQAFPFDATLGETTVNIGKLLSDNPQNILSPELRCRVYFRTTFASDGRVHEWMMNSVPGDGISVRFVGGDIPSAYTVFEGFPSGPVAFGSDAPHLTGFRRKIICGPGSIRYAHRDDEHVLVADLEQAVRNYIRFFELA